MKKQLEESISLVGELIAETPQDSPKMPRLLALLGTLQGLLITQILMP